MKKILVSIFALLSVATVTMAQDEQQSKENRPHFDRSEMIQKRTEMMVKKYGLNDEQAAQLKALNEKSMPEMRGPRPGGPRPEGGDSIKGQRPPRPEMGDSTQFKGQRPEGGEHKGGRGGHRGGPDFKKYNEELQKIMTADQFKAYTEDMEKMKNQRPPRREQKEE